MTTHLLIIDPQNSFCHPEGALYVPGAEEDMKRLADFLRAAGDRIDRATVTLDSHNKIHIAHPNWWVDADGNPPDPFTGMTFEEVRDGRWRAADPDHQEWSMLYMRQVGSQTVWPVHCLIGTQEHEVFGELLPALNDWRAQYDQLDFLFKGFNRYTEHFSAIRAAVEIIDDPFTHLNRALLRVLEAADTVLVAGEAASHCVADTLDDIVEYSEDKKIGSKLTLLTDTMSAVPGFEETARAFYGRMETAGARFTTTDRVFSG